MSEHDLYPPVKKWLDGYLKRNLQRCTIQTYIGADEYLSKILIREGLSNKIKNSPYFDLKIDVFAVITKREKSGLVIVECKQESLGLASLGQSLGYSKIINPLHSILLSKKGMSRNLINFLELYENDELLHYGENKKIILSSWVEDKEEIDIKNCYPKNSLAPFKLSAW